MNLQKRLTKKLTISEKKVFNCCKCNKTSVIVEHNKYYCGKCYCRMKGIKIGKI